MATATKYFDCTPASTSGLSDWVQIEVTDPDFCAIPLGDGDITAAFQDGTSLPVLVLTRNSSAIRVTVALGSPVDATVAQRIALTVTDGGVASEVWTGWTKRHTEGPEVGPLITIKDGAGNSLVSDQWVHPNVYRVDTIQPGEPGYWMRFSTEAMRDAGTPDVTHIRIDTAFITTTEDDPRSNESWENPYLLYATDGLGLEWYEWNATINPIEAWPGGSNYNSDPSLAIRSDGSLYAAYRRYIASHVLHYRLVTGTCLEDATAGARQTPTADWAQAGTSPSILPYGDEWLMFHRLDGDWLMRVSTDEGDTWGGASLIIRDANEATGDGTEYTRRFWHGSASGPFDGWYYLLLSENKQGVGNQTAATFRAFRTRNPKTGPWEAGRSLLIPYGAGSTVAVGGWYQGCIFQRSDDSLAICGSGFSGGNIHGVAVTPISLADGQTQTERQAFQMDIPAHAVYGVATVLYNVNPTDRGSVTEVDGWAAPVGIVWEYRAEVSVQDADDWSELMPWQEWTEDGYTSAATYAAGTYEVRMSARDRDTPDDAVLSETTQTVTLEEPGPIIIGALRHILNALGGI